jgi:uncharacterized protein involved in response to NO
MSGWQTARTASDALLWSLHLGYAWLVVGFGCIAAGGLFGASPWTSGLHALTSGAIGATILAVMTRVGVAHTGRELVAPRGIPLAYLLISAGALLRTAGPAAFPAQARAALLASGLLWSAGLLLFAVIYAPILTRPRPDGRPG